MEIRLKLGLKGYCTVTWDQKLRKHDRRTMSWSLKHVNLILIWLCKSDLLCYGVCRSCLTCCLSAGIRSRTSSTASMRHTWMPNHGSIERWSPTRGSTAASTSSPPMVTGSYIIGSSLSCDSLFKSKDLLSHCIREVCRCLFLNICSLNQLIRFKDLLFSNLASCFLIQSFHSFIPSFTHSCIQKFYI